MTRTTPPPPFDVASLWPEAAGLRRATVRLHPRCDPTVGPDQSSMGGPIRWPRDVPWPECDLPHEDYSGFSGARPARPDPGTRYVPILQLLESDVPELPFRDGTDVFQLLWCPNDHTQAFSMLCRAVWWAREQLLDATAPPAPTVARDDYVPRPCSVHPEPVDEYPGFEDLPDDLQSRVGAWEDGQESTPYQSALSTAPGSKVGGHPQWFQGPEWPTCPAGHEMEHLLTISDHEFDGGTWQRWLPIEETGMWEWPTDRQLGIQEPTHLSFGMASIYVFLCRACPAWPIDTVYQR